MSRERLIKWNNELLTWNNQYIRPKDLTQDVDPWPTDGLVARWAFNNTLEDTGPNGLTFDVNAGTVAYTTAKSSGNCLLLTNDDILSKYSTTAWSCFDASHAMTVAWWQYCTRTTACGLWSCWSYAANKFAEAFLLPSNAGVEISMARSQATGNSKWSYVSETIINTWVHIVQTYDGTNIKQYTNGNTTPEVTTASAQLMEHFNYFEIGRAADGAAGGGMEGKLEKMYVYDRAISITDISTLYNGGTPI